MPVFFAFPVCLLGLIPWAMLLIYMLAGRRRRVPVPFLELWPRAGFEPKSRRKWQIPPAVAAVLSAIFLAILAAAGPQIRRVGTDRPVVIIIDRGLTMSARRGSLRRFQALANQVADDISQTLGPGPANLVFVPGSPEQIIDRSQFAAAVAAADATAADTRAALLDAARKYLQDPRAIVILLSDQAVDVDDNRLVRIVPAPIQNIAIADLSVRATPRPGAMVRVLNDSDQHNATLTVSSASPLSMALPAFGQARNYFLDLTEAPPVVEASIAPGGDIDADDHAWAVRQSARPILQMRGALPPELRRFVNVYQKDRPAGAESRVVALVNDDLPANQPAVVIPAPFTEKLTDPVQWSPHLLTQGIDWKAATIDAQVSPIQPSAGWNRLVWSGDRTLLAARPGQLWVGFRSAAWATTPDFVLFWARALDTLGQGPPRYVHQTVGPADVPLWPGIYDNMAVNAPEVHLNPATSENWQSRLTALAAAQTAGRASLGPWMLFAALACLMIAAWRWN